MERYVAYGKMLCVGRPYCPGGCCNDKPVYCLDTHTRIVEPIPPGYQAADRMYRGPLCNAPDDRPWSGETLSVTDALAVSLTTFLESI